MTNPVEGAQSGAEQDPQAQSGQGESASTTGEGTQSGTTEAEKPADSGVPREEFDKVRARMQAADARASKAEQELRQLKEKDLPEQERQTKLITELTAKAEKLEADLRKARVNNAFLTYTGEGKDKYRWKDPAAALQLVDLSEVEVTEDGTVTGLDRALKALAGKYPWLLEDKTSVESAENAPSPAAPPMNGKSSTAGTPKETMTRRFPAMRGRVRPQ